MFVSPQPRGMQRKWLNGYFQATLLIYRQETLLTAVLTAVLWQ